MSILPARLYPGMQCTSTLVPWSTGSEVFVSRLKISAGSSVHLSENYEIMSVDGLALLYFFRYFLNGILTFFTNQRKLPGQTYRQYTLIAETK